MDLVLSLQTLDAAESLTFLESKADFGCSSGSDICSGSSGSGCCITSGTTMLY